MITCRSLPATADTLREFRRGARMRLVFTHVIVILSLLVSCGDLGAGSAVATAVSGLSTGHGASSPPVLGRPPTGAGFAAPTPQIARPGSGITPTPRGGLVLVSPAQLTLADNEALVRLRVGDVFAVNLDAAPVAPSVPINATSTTPAPVQWTVQFSDPAVVVRVSDQVRGPYRAAAPGAADLTVTGHPLCCGNPGPPDLVFRVHIVVR